MIKINKHNTSIKDLEVGSILHLNELYENNKSDFVNDCILGFVEKNGVLNEMKIWIRHLFDETELPNGDRFSEILEKDETGEFETFPNKIILVGLNNETKKMIVKSFDL